MTSLWWTPERVEVLSAQWNNNILASQIAKTLGTTKNAVIGKAHRLALPARPSPLSHDGTLQQRRSKALARPTAPRETIVPLKPQENEPAVLVTRHGCQWINGEPSGDNACKCGKPARSGSPYCPTHHNRCYLNREPRKVS